jgi:N utilization substance protein B
MSPPAKPSRRRARQAALQALYQWQMTGQSSDEIVEQFSAEKSLEGADRDYFVALLQGVRASVEDLDARLSPILDRTVAQLDPVERAILRIGVYELEHRADVPWRVIINEGVELAHVFGAEQSHRYVNGILDKLARRIRPEAAEAAGGKSRAVSGGAEPG